MHVRKGITNKTYQKPSNVHKNKSCVEINDKVIFSNIFKIVSGSGIGKQIAQAVSTNCKGK